MRERAEAAYKILLWLAVGWVLFNCAQVYLVFWGGRTYRIESAAFIAVAVMLPAIVSGGWNRPSPPEWTPRIHALALAIPALLWASLLLPLLRYPFLSDDYVFLGRYDTLSDVTIAHEFFRPAFAVVFLALEKIGGGSAVPFHVASLALHFASACLAYSLASRVFQSRPLAAIVFAVFLLNPLQLEAVLWTSGLQELLWTTCALAALRCYVGTTELSARRLACTLALTCVALLAKETAVSLLLLFPLFDLVLFRFRRGKLLPAFYLVAIASFATYFLFRQRFVALDERLLVAPSRFFIKQFIATPYKVFVQPWNAQVLSGATWLAFIVSTVAAIMLGIAVAKRRAGLLFLAGAAVILISTLPVYTYFYVGPDVSGGRYVYFAALGWGLLVAHLFAGVRPGAAALLGMHVLLAVALVGALRINLVPWREAGDLVARMRATAIDGGDPLVAAAEWQVSTGARVTMKNRVPHSLHGVGLFINGYPEFLEMYRNGRSK